MKFELFNAIAHPGSAQVRKWIQQAGILHKLRFRNVVYPEIEADLLAGGGSIERLPALWDGESLHEGESAVVKFLSNVTR